MPREREQEGFTRRAFVLGGMQVSLLALLVGRLGFLQLFKGSYYHLLSEENRLSMRVVAPTRGRILDRAGTILAYNTKSFRTILIPEIIINQKISVQEHLQTIAPILDLSEEEIERILKDVKKKPKFLPTILKENIPWEEVARLELLLVDLLGVQIEEAQRRGYTFPDICAHIVGYIGMPSDEDIEESPYLNQAGMKVGKAGIEAKYEESLRGETGIQQIEVNARGRSVREVSFTPPIVGQDLVTTLDAQLQILLMQELSQFPSAAGALMDITTGGILALGSTPSFDPSLFSGPIPKDKWQEIQQNSLNPLINKVTSGLYSPGSTFKMCVALAALEKGIITPQTSFFCPGFLYFGGHKFHCWKKEGHGSVALKKAIHHSCDIYFYEIGHKVGIDAIAQMANRLGLGRGSGLDLKGEKKGVIPTQAWKREKLNQKWHPGETLVAAIGQGYVLSTPFELLCMTARLANGGYEVFPTLIPQEKKDLVSLGIDPTHLSLVLEGMAAVCNEPGGTGYRYRITEPGFEMAGKTGTSQVKRITLAERAQGVKNKDLAWHLRHHALFVGYAPLYSPRYAMCAVVEHGGEGGIVAIPVVQKLLLAAQKGS